MTETAQPTTGAQPSGTSSTPDTGSQPAPAAQPAQAAAVPPETKPAESQAKPADSATQPTEKKAEPPKTEATPPADAPLFNLPDDVQISPESRSKFETVIKGKIKDGNLQLSPQDVVDMYVEQARDAYKSWETQITAQDQAWKTESEKRFNKEQLAAAETGVGFLSSFDPSFRELTKGIANHPSFVNVMRVIGERLSEDTFEIEGSRAPLQKRAAKDVLYPKRN